MASPDRSITIHKCFFIEQASKVKTVISEILQKESLSAGDTKAIRVLTDVYDSLVNPVPENYTHHWANYSSGYREESQ